MGSYCGFGIRALFKLSYFETNFGVIIEGVDQIRNVLWTIAYGNKLWYSNERIINLATHIEKTS